MQANRGTRNVVLLAGAQALYGVSTSLMAVTAPFVGTALTGNHALATMPIGVQHLALMIMTVPASFLMRRIGRRAGFMAGIAIGVTGAAVAALAVWLQNFPLFLAGAFLIGSFNGFAVFYRFAAADTAAPAMKARAISLVLGGGVVAAFIGPQLAIHAKDLLAPVTFAGCYVAQIGVLLLSFAVIAFVDIPPLTATERADSGRPLAVILRQPTCMVAIATAMIAYGVMALIMTSTPLAMADRQFVFGDAAFVIQWHIVGMFAPSFVTGWLIRRLGLTTVMLTGVGLNLACCLLNLGQDSLSSFWAALLLLGVGWNFMFISATTLLTECYTPSERAKVQGLNDFLVWGTVATSAFASGGLLRVLGWQTVNVAVVPLLVLALGVVFWLHARRAYRPA